jgi:MerR family transcriptional regulator/heat shock protein HspR
MSSNAERKGLFTLVVAARLVGLSPARVRHCVRLGLVTPASTEGGTLAFSRLDLARLRRIRRMREDLGVNMAGIEIAMRLFDQLAAMRAKSGR